MKTLRRITMLFTVVGLIVLLLGTGVLQAVGNGQGQSGTTLSETVTANGHWTRTFGWTITKSVDPASWELFKGDSGVSQYTVAVTKDNGVDAYWVDGEICVTNGGDWPTQSLQINAVVQHKVGNDWVAYTSAPVALGDWTVLPPVTSSPNNQHCYPYTVTFTPVAGKEYKVFGETTIMNHSGSLGTPKGPQGKASFSFPLSPLLINDEINVNDTNGKSWVFDDTDSVSYTKTFTCDADKGKHSNTATISETGQTSSASVTVSCYSLNVTKTANTSFKRTYDWDIAKSGPTGLTLAIGQQFLATFSVQVSATYVDSAWAVAGDISVYNPAPTRAAKITSVEDVISDAGAAEVKCGVDFPYQLAADETLKCTYEKSLPNAASRTNTATAKLQNYTFDYQGGAIAGGTTEFFKTISFGFANATIDYVDECVMVSDDRMGELGGVCYSNLPKTFSPSMNVGPYQTCGNYQFTNTASFKTNDTSATGSSAWTIPVNVPCAGCTRTIGYWKTHAGFGPQADQVSKWLPLWLGTPPPPCKPNKSVNVTTAGQAVGLLSFSGEASNGINKLYAQLLAAKLNIAAGAGGGAIAATQTAADSFLAANNAANWAALSRTDRNNVLGWATLLDKYNNGLIGPGHCSE